MGSKIHSQIHGTARQGSFCGAPGLEEAEEDVLEEGRYDQIPFQRGEIWVLMVGELLELIYKD